MRPDDVDDLGACAADRVEQFDVGDGRTLVIRPTTGDDAHQLEVLYRALDPDDQRRRFFTAWSPQETWCRSWASVAERGGFGVIAIVTHHAGETAEETAGETAGETVAGEAGYAILSDGDGELGVTVADDWRGWLGAYLVDRIVEHAAANGIENLQADVLLENSPMRRILAHRGAVVFNHDGGTDHVAISTAGHVPSWPPGETRRRVLVEAIGGRWSGEGAASNADIAVAVCRGPSRRQRHGCPVLTGGRCPLADDAHAIVVLLDPDDEEVASIVDAHVAQNPSTPVFVRRTEETPDGCRSLSGDLADDLSEILRAASGSTSDKNSD
jgi:hypothetical protein